MPIDYEVPTFGDRVAADELIYIHCKDCGRWVEILAGAIVHGIPHDTPFPQIVNFLKCSRCGGREIDVMPEVYPGGFIGSRDRFEHGPSRALQLYDG